jgi:hypothetical protein
VTVERHLGRYFIAGTHRFHVFDDWSSGGPNPTWRTSAAMVVLLTDKQVEQIQEAAKPLNLTVTFEVGIDSFTYDELVEAPTALPGPAPPSRPAWRPPAPPAGPDEPTETW